MSVSISNTVIIPCWEHDCEIKWNKGDLDGKENVVIVVRKNDGTTIHHTCPADALRNHPTMIESVYLDSGIMECINKNTL